MKFSLNSIQALNKQYKLSADTTKVGIDKLVKIIGSQLGEVDAIEEIGKKYEGIIIAEVKTCIKHPNADKLNVCMIDDGGKAKQVKRDKNGLVQVVCGAPNVKAGIFVAWLPPGATVPETFDTDPFVLGSRELRGVVSNGMLASPKELALGESHDGILILEGKQKAGRDFAENYGLKNDQVIDIENKMFTHRPDCFGLIGISRELAGIQNLAFKSPEWYKSQSKIAKPQAKTLPLKITNDIPKLCQRFSAIVISGVKVQPSPVWLLVELVKVGLKPINNIVDYTNYFSYLTAQPLHAYDYDKVAKMSGKTPTITVRLPKKGESIDLLNGKTIEPWDQAIMIATDKELLGIGGVMGGSQSEVDQNTTNIIIESANFDMYSIRRTSMNHGLFTDAVTRFNKGQSPLQTLTVLARITDEILADAGGRIASQVYDINHLSPSVNKHQAIHSTLKITADEINKLLGLSLSVQEMVKLLSNVEFGVKVSGQNLSVTAPFWRTDIEYPEDIVEEVGRLYGYDKSTLQLPIRSSRPSPINPILNLKSDIRNVLAKSGTNEVLSYSFVHGKLLEQSNQSPEKAYQIANALSPDLQYYRLSISPSLLDKIHPNIKAGFDYFGLFEIGKTHSLDNIQSDGLPAEEENLALVVSASSKSKKATSAFYQAKYLLNDLAKSLNLELDFRPVTSKDDGDYLKPFELHRSAIVSIAGQKNIVGVVGEYKTSVRRNFKLPDFCGGFEININALFEATQKTTSHYQPLSRFPKVTQDITLKTPVKNGFGKTESALIGKLKKYLPKETIFSLEPASIYQAKPTEKTINYSFKMQIVNYERTLTDKEVNKILDKISTELKTDYQIERV